MFLKYIKNPKNMLFLKKKKACLPMRKGFSLLEVIISVFIFSLMMVTISMTFASLFKSYKNTKAIQTNLENAQFAMNTMAKSLRTSSIVIPLTSGLATTVKFFNYSDNNCISYTFNNSTHSLKVASATNTNSALDSVGKVAWCKTATLSTPSSIMPDTVGNVVFNVTPSSVGPPKVMGKVTISMKVCANTTCSVSQDKAIIQSSVSLRDYNAVD